MTKPRILIAGIGNIFFGDDGFGVEVAQRLLQRPLPDGVKVVDFGIRGMDLAYAMLDGYDAVILVDAARRGREPGTLYVVEPDLEELETESPNQLPVEAHGMVPAKVLRFVKALGGDLPAVRLVGCEPATLGSGDDFCRLSQPVQRSVDEAVELVESVAAELLSSERAERAC